MSKKNGLEVAASSKSDATETTPLVSKVSLSLSFFNEIPTNIVTSFLLNYKTIIAIICLLNKKKTILRYIIKLKLSKFEFVWL